MRKMRLFTVLAAAITTFSLCAALQSNDVKNYQIDVSKFPTCGLMCLIQTAPAAGCGITDFGCMCTSQKMIDLTTKCVLTKCTIEEGFVMLREQADACQYGNESKNYETKATIIFVSVITKTMMILRMTLRWFTQGRFGWDDWLILVAFATDTTALYADIQLLENGIGEHIWNVSQASVERLLLWAYVVLCMYVVTNGLIKLSVLSFYLRIFSTSKRFKYLCWMTFAFVAATTISFTFVTILQCVPISNAFLVVPKTGYCVNDQAATWTLSALTVLQDILVLFLPIMEILALQMSSRKKVGVSLVFILGGLVVIASVVRMYVLKGFGRTSDPTWTNQPTILWSAIELGIGMMCACIPGIYSGIRVLWPDILAFTSRHIPSYASNFTSSSSSSQAKQRNESKGTYSSSGSSARATPAYMYRNDNIKHTPSQKRRFRSASMDLPLTEMTIHEHEEHDNEDSKVEMQDLNHVDTSDGSAGASEQVLMVDNAEKRVSLTRARARVVENNKPYPPLPSPSLEQRRELARQRIAEWRRNRAAMGVIEAVTTVTIVNEAKEEEKMTEGSADNFNEEFVKGDDRMV